MKEKEEKEMQEMAESWWKERQGGERSNVCEIL